MGKKKGRAIKEPAPLGPILINGKPMSDRTAKAVRRMIAQGATPCGVLNLLLIREALKTAKRAAKEIADAGIPPMA